MGNGWRREVRMGRRRCGTYPPAANGLTFPGNTRAVNCRMLVAGRETLGDGGTRWDEACGKYATAHLSGRELLTLKGPGTSSVSWSPDGKRLATGSKDGTAKMWEVASRRELRLLKGHIGGVLSVSWSPDGKRLATGSSDGTAKVWEVASGRELLTLKGHA